MSQFTDTAYNGEFIYDSIHTRLYYWRGVLYRLPGNFHHPSANRKNWDEMTPEKRDEFVNSGMVVCNYICKIVQSHDKQIIMKFITAEQMVVEQLMTNLWLQPLTLTAQNKNDLIIIISEHTPPRITKFTLADSWYDALYPPMTIVSNEIISTAENKDIVVMKSRPKPIIFTCPSKLRSGPIQPLQDTLEFADLYMEIGSDSNISTHKMIEMENYHGQIIFLSAFANHILDTNIKAAPLDAFSNYLQRRELDPMVKFGAKDKECLMDVIRCAKENNYRTTLGKLMPVIMQLEIFNYSRK